MSSAALILVSFICLASVVAWLFAFFRMARGEPVIEFLGERSSHPHKYVFAFAMLVAFVMLAFSGSQSGDHDATDPIATALEEVDDKPIEVELAEPADVSNDASQDEEAAAAQTNSLSATLPEPSSEIVLVGSLVVTFAFTACLWAVVAGTTPTLDGWGVRLDNVSGQIRIGICCAAAAFLPTMLIGLLTQDLGEEQLIIQMLRESNSVFVWALVAGSAVIVAPLMEEVMFRVVIQGWLTSRFKAEPAIAWTALLFAAVHGWPAMVGLMPFALIAGHLYYQSRSILSNVVMHMTFNGTMLLVLAFEVMSES